MKSLPFLVTLVLPLAAASAATLTVNTTVDNTTPGDGRCTLREAIANVNAAADTTSGDCAAGTGAGDTINFNLPSPAPSPPSRVNWLGTDDQGRDVLARLIYGFRISVLFGLTLTAISSVVGVAAGAVQGYFGGIVDLGFQRFIEIWSGLPVLYLLIIMASFVEPNFWWLLGLMLLFSWMSLVDVVRAEFLRGRNLDYVRAARALGVPDRIIILRHVLPNATVATITFLPFILNGSITTLTSLDFLGFGLPPGSASLGELLAQGKANLQAPWLGLTAFFVLASMLSLLIFVGEAVRDAFDPRKVTL